MVLFIGVVRVEVVTLSSQTQAGIERGVWLEMSVVFLCVRSQDTVAILGGCVFTATEFWRRDIKYIFRKPQIAPF